MSSEGWSLEVASAEPTPNASIGAPEMISSWIRYSSSPPEAMIWV
jgi:hypothetical protein